MRRHRQLRPRNAKELPQELPAKCSGRDSEAQDESTGRLSCLTKTVNREKDLKRRESAELLRSTPQLAEKKNTTSGRGASFAMFASRSLKNIRYLPPSQTSTNVRISTLHFQKNKAVSIHYISSNDPKNSSCNVNRQDQIMQEDGDRRLLSRNSASQLRASASASASGSSAAELHRYPECSPQTPT